MATELELTIYRRCKENILHVINEQFVVLHMHYKTKQGDITPEQQIQLDQLIEDLAKLMAKQIHQNL